MIMKKQMIIALLALLPVLGWGQKYDGIRVSYHAGPTAHFWNPKPFNTFVESYNTYMASLLESPLTEFKSTSSSFSRGFGGWSESNGFVFGMDYLKSQFNPTIESSFKNGRGNLIELEFTDWMVNVELGKRFGTRWVINSITGVNLRSGVVRVNVIHFDGSLSQGDEFYFAGVYRSVVQSDFTLGVKLRFDLAPFASITFSGIRTLPFFDTEESRSLRTFEDDRPGKALSTIVFPADYQKYEENAQNGIYDYENNIIPMDFRGWYINASLALNLKILKL